MNNFICNDIIKIDNKIGEILFNCSDNKVRKFNIKNIFNSKKISNGMKETWKSMFNSNYFGKVYLDDGYIIWPGFCEIFPEDVNDFLEVV